MFGGFLKKPMISVLRIGAAVSVLLSDRAFPASGA
jgi:hypothetical protein